MKIKPLNRHVLTSRQINRRGHTIVRYWKNGWRFGYITTFGRKWATGRVAADGTALKLPLKEEGRSWFKISK